MRNSKFFAEETIRKILNKLGKTDISHIGDGTVTGGLNTLNDSLKWKLQGTAVGTTSIPLPDDYNELLVIAYNNSADVKIIANHVVPKEEITSEIKALYNAFNTGSASDAYFCRITFSTNGIAVNNAAWSTSITNVVLLKVYYR